MNQSWTPVAIASALWFLALTLQLADLGSASFDFRRLARHARTVVRLHPVAWVVPVGATVLVGVGLGVDFAGRLFEQDSPLGAIIVSTLLVVVAVAAWLVITVAVTRPSADSYRAIRDELLEHAGTRVQQDWLDELRVRLVDVDRDSERSKPPVAVTWGSAVRWVFVRTQRVVPPLFALGLLVTVCIAAAGDPRYAWIVIPASGALVLSCVLAVTGSAGIPDPHRGSS